ncbi:MAG: GspH/FimT family pseudopilin [Gammaproteobacteria bacterium]|nr:GspH/FimT family pseudopilin [Gammaproteobacteria bacterium]NND59935.1 prepilin-type N-terminal cleavage/methylation domain-containing protein [Gammaproteobacteria bacterium]
MINQQRGFTLVELLYTLAVAALIMGVGVPTFTQTMRNSSMTATTNSIVTAMHSARSEAIKRRGRVTVCPAELVGAEPACQADGTSLLVFANVADDASFDSANGDLIIQFQDWIRGDVTTTGADLPGYVTYTAAGFTRAIGGGQISGNLVFCDERGTPSARVLNLSATGRPQIRRHADMTGPVPACSP